MRTIFFSNSYFLSRKDYYISSYKVIQNQQR